ncbi:MAG: SDR family oxidoreductase [Candidatus Dadabacteria bacterium]|nr:MAG: SDR family oxidoreductase [Candidatus Dadabacteria bacterium]
MNYDINSTAVVTGAGAGIGRAIAKRLAADGFSVAVWDIDANRADTVAAEIEAAGGHAAPIPCDVADRDSVAEAAALTRKRLGTPLALVNNAGVDTFNFFKDSRAEDWERIVRVNFIGTLNVTKALLDDMIAARCGRIVCIGSDAGRVGSSGEAVYAGTKAGIIGFVKALAREVARYGIAANVVCPGPTEAGLLETIRSGPKGEKIVEAMIRAIPMGRTARPEEVAAAVSFFLSPDAGYITGQTLSVSGGLTMA